MIMKNQCALTKICKPMKMQLFVQIWHLYTTWKIAANQRKHWFLNRQFQLLDFTEKSRFQLLKSFWLFSATGWKLGKRNWSLKCTISLDHLEDLWECFLDFQSFLGLHLELTRFFKDFKVFHKTQTLFLPDNLQHRWICHPWCNRFHWWVYDIQRKFFDISVKINVWNFLKKKLH